MNAKTEIFKKCHFGDRNDRIWLKNDDSPGESFPLTNFQSKSCTNFSSNRILAPKKNNHRNEYFRKKSCFAGRNEGIWPKNDEPLTVSYLLTHFKSKSWTNLSETEFWHKKNAISETETKEFVQKMMILQGSPSHWPISNRKVALICLKLNFEKNAMSEAEMMEFGRKMINLSLSPMCWPISNRKVAPI